MTYCFPLSLPKGLHVTHDCVEISITQLHGRHQRAGLDRVWVLNPKFEVFWCILGSAGGNGCPAHQVCEVWTEAPVGIRSCHGMTVHAGIAFENSPASLYACVLNGRLLLSTHPGSKIFRSVYGDA